MTAQLQLEVTGQSFQFTWRHLQQIQFVSSWKVGKVIESNCKADINCGRKCQVMIFPQVFGDVARGEANLIQHGTHDGRNVELEAKCANSGAEGICKAILAHVYVDEGDKTQKMHNTAKTLHSESLH